MTEDQRHSYKNQKVADRCFSAGARTVAFAILLGAMSACSPGESPAPSSPASEEARNAEENAASPPSTDPAAVTPALPELAGTSWRLVEIQSMDDSVYAPDDPSSYTLSFGADGTALVRSDCNRGTGSWDSASPGQLTFGPMATTKALCPPGSMDERFVAQFPWVRSYVLKDGRLFLATMADGSIVEFEPLSEAVAAATVLGEDIEAEDASQMQQAILQRLFAKYAAEKQIAATPGEIDAFEANLDRMKAEDQAARAQRIADIDQRLARENLEGAERSALDAERTQEAELLASLEDDSSLSAEEAGQVRAMREQMAKSIIEQWKLNKALYEQYGGRIIFQQLGPEPLDAYRQFLQERQAAGDFVIHESSFEPEFWRYFTDDSLHSFMDPGSEEEARAFAAPPWGKADTAS